MSSSSIYNFMKNNGVMGRLHHLVFPIDHFSDKTPEFIASKKQRFVELTPIMIWLIPLILLLTNTTALNGIGLIIFCLLEVIMLVVLSAFYCWRAHPGFLIEIFSNYALSFIIWGLILFLITSIIPCIGCEVIVFILFIVISLFSRSGDYDDD